ncbi:cytochrome ubiquinol oxidase subunit I, partial [Bordetella petrii]|nr:cytochrome ubiquinol oxidase subunit I [Bordetella petrii]
RAAGRQCGVRAGLPLGTLMLALAVGLEADAQWQSGLRPQDSAYAAAVYALLGLQAALVIATGFMGLFTAARSWAGKVSAQRHACVANTAALWQYTVVQGLAITLVVHGFPRWMG